MSRPTLDPQRWAWPALLLGAVAIGFSPLFVRVSELGPVATAFHRVALALPLLGLWQWRQRDRTPLRAADIVWLLTAGLLFAADLALWHWSIRLTTVANATLFANFAPLTVTLGAWWLFGERMTPMFLVSLALALLGAAMLLGVSLGLDARYVLGDLLGLATALFYGAYLLTVSRLRARLSTATLMAVSGVSATLALAVIAAASGESLWPQSARGWAVLLGLAWFSHLAGQSLIAYALAHLSVAFSSVSLLLQPVVAALLAWWILAEVLNGVQLLGGGLVLAGIGLARRQVRAQSPPE